MKPLAQKWRAMFAGRAASDETSPESLTAANGVTAFAFQFYRHLSNDQPQNLIFSPLSIWLALMMLHAGARGHTADQLARALHLSSMEDDPHATAAMLAAELASRQSTMFEYDQFRPEDFPELNIANRLWGQIGTPFEAAYLDLLEKSYASDMAQADFAGGAFDTIADEINAWVAEQTRDKIPQIVNPLMMSSLTRLILVNAIYFKGLWKFPFVEYATHDAPFHLMDGGTATVRMMYLKEALHYHMGSDYAAVNLPYRGGALAMLVIMPTKGSFLDFERQWLSSTFNMTRTQPTWMDWSDEKVEIYLPRFEMSTGFSLIDGLTALGVHDAFDPSAADFSGMAVVPQEQNLYVGAGVHRAYIKVDESGTEAAGATAIAMQARAMVEKRPPVIRFDHPFNYIVYDVLTHAILFMGRVINPAE